jgi:hypothetical protein
MIQEIINTIEETAYTLPIHERLAVLTNTKQLALEELNNETGWDQLQEVITKWINKQDSTI